MNEVRIETTQLQGPFTAGKKWNEKDESDLNALFEQIAFNGLTEDDPRALPPIVAERPVLFFARISDEEDPSLGRIVSMATVSECMDSEETAFGYLYNMVTDRRYRGKKFGKEKRSLAKEILLYAASFAKIRRLQYLRADVRSGNSIADALYFGVGFELYSELKGDETRIYRLRLKGVQISFEHTKNCFLMR